MAGVISNSAQTLAVGGTGAWWTPTAAAVSVDVDNNASVVIESRRGSGDASPKQLLWGGLGSSPVISGPCSVIVQTVVGRDYRFVQQGPRPAIVAAME